MQYFANNRSVDAAKTTDVVARQGDAKMTATVS